jgi:hypothetical protein
MSDRETPEERKPEKLLTGKEPKELLVAVNDPPTDPPEDPPPKGPGNDDA